MQNIHSDKALTSRIQILCINHRIDVKSKNSRDELTDNLLSRCKYKSVIIIMVFVKPLAPVRSIVRAVSGAGQAGVAAVITYLLIKYSVATANPRPSQHSL